MSEGLAERKKVINKKKPKFTRQDCHKKALGEKWRKPKGLDNKMRWGIRGYKRCVEIGWGRPKELKFLQKDGRLAKIVNNLKELQAIDKEKEAAIIASGVGLKNKLQMAKTAKEQGIKIMNIKDIEKFVSEVEANIEKKNKAKEEKAKKKEDKKKEAEKKVKEAEKKTEAPKDELSEKVDEEEKKKQEKQEKDKILTKKEQ